jgi:hypothetical protein
VEFPPATLRNSNGIMQVPWKYTPQDQNYKQPADAASIVIPITPIDDKMHEHLPR